MPWKLGSTVIKAGSSWVDANKIRHPYNWSIWTNDQKKAVGLAWSDPSPQDAPFDNKFYSGRKANGDLIEKSLTDTLWVDVDGKAVTDPLTGKQGVTKGLISNWKDKTKEQGHTLLSKTDWYVTRKAEASTAIPSDISTYRTNVRTATKTIEDKLDACDTLAKFIALFDIPKDSNGMPTGNAPIYDFPDEVS